MSSRIDSEWLSRAAAWAAENEGDIPIQIGGYVHITHVTLKSGKEIQGIIWEWRPQEGYFTLTSDGDPVRVEFADVAAGYTGGERQSRTRIGDEDILERYKRDLALLAPAQPDPTKP